MQVNVQISFGNIIAVARHVDLIVNAANPTLLGGGGVDGAIHRAAGPQLRKYLQQLLPDAAGARCQVGGAVWSPGFALPCSIIHTVGPIFPTGRPPSFAGEQVADSKAAPLLLAACVRRCLSIAVARDLQSIAFPAISCGFYGGQPAVLASLAKKVLAERDWNLHEVRFVLYTEGEFNSFQAGWDCCDPTPVPISTATLQEILGCYCALEQTDLPEIEGIKLALRLEELFRQCGRRIPLDEAWELTR